MMANRLRLALAGFLLASWAAATGCVGGPDPVLSHQEDLALGLPAVSESGSEGEIVALARDLWLDGDSCADAGLLAKSTGHEVRWAIAGEILFVEIDGVLACAGDAGELSAEERSFFRLNRGTSPDEGGPEPEPADPGESGPEPEPANPDHGGCGDQQAAPRTGGEDQQGGEDQGGPEPEPAFATGDDGGSFAGGASGSGAQ